MSYGWIVIVVTLVVVAGIWVVGIGWQSIKQWWDYHVNERDHRRTSVRETERERRRLDRLARKQETTVDP